MPALIEKNGQPTWRYRPGPFADAFQRAGLSINELARRLGTSDAAARRTLALAPETTGKYRTSIGYETAVKLCRALGLDPVEVGV